jgi:hypothetical protein
MKKQFRITFSAYSVTLTLMSTLIVIFVTSFFLGYFNPNFVAEYRTAAPISTVLGFIKGINPFQEEHIEMYGNLYSVVWPGMIYLIAKLLGLASYDQIKLLMYILNALIVMSTAAVAFCIGLRNQLNALLALAISFTYFLLNSTKISMGEFSYSAGMSCSFFALVLVSNKFNKFALCMALALITLASLFKVYFALLAIVVAFNCAAFIPVGILMLILCAWVIVASCLFFGLGRVFPFYFDSIYLVIKMFVTWYPPLIVQNIRWFLGHFGFIFIFILPQLIQFKQLATEEKRRQKLYAAGSLIVCVYVFFVMLPNAGNFGTYLLHIVAPIILAYGLSCRKEFAAAFERRTGQIAAVAICMIVFIDPKFRWSPLHHWKEYGVLWRDDLTLNRAVFMEVDNVIRSSAGREVYVPPPLWPLAIKRHLGYVDNGNRELYAAYLNARRNGSLQLSPLISWLAASEPRGPERVLPVDEWKGADVVICMLLCPTTTHKFVKDLGVLTTAWNGSFVIRFYHKETK